MKIRLVIAAFLLFSLVVPFTADAQENGVEYLSTRENDFQLRTGFELEKKFAQKFSVKLNEEFRLKDSFKEVDRINSELEFSYRATDWLKVATVYRFMAIDHAGKKRTNYQKYWDLRHRLSFNLAFYYRTCTNWKFSLKERVQSTFMQEKNYNKLEKNSPMWVLRSRIKAEYKLRHLPIAPYAFVELNNLLNAPSLADGNYVNKIRSAVGMEYRFNHRNSVDIVYYFDYNFDKDIDVKKSTGTLKSITEEKEFNHILSLTYKFRF